MVVDHLKNVDYKMTKEKKYKIRSIPILQEDSINQKALFAIEPLEVGHAITIGNALRRTLLSDITGYSISSFRINGVPHEFSVLPYLREDIMEIMLNLKQLVFRALPEGDLASDSNLKLKALLDIKGPRIVTAAHFQLPFNQLTLLNPNQYICTIVDNSSLFMEVEIEKGKAYKLIDEKEIDNTLQKVEPDKKGRKIFIDSVYSPVKNVNFKVKLITDSDGNIKESLLFEITTNGSTSPKRVLLEAARLLIDLFTPLLITEEFSEVIENINKIEVDELGEDLINSINYDDVSIEENLENIEKL